MMSTLAEFVRLKREELGMNQTELSERCDLPRTTINRIESGHTKLPTPDFRRRLAAGLGVSHLDILLAAGEITQDELDSETQQRNAEASIPVPILNKLRQIDDWTLPRRRYVLTAVDQMLELERSIQAYMEESGRLLKDIEFRMGEES